MSARRLWSVVVVCLACSCRAASAQENALSPPIKGLDIKQICSAPNPRYMLARSIVANYKLSLDFIDWNDRGIDYDDYVSAISMPLCRAGNLSAAQDAKCFVPNTEPGVAGQRPLGAEALSQFQMFLEVNKALLTAQTATGFIEIGSTKAALQFRRLRSVTPVDTARQPLLAQGDNVSIGAQIFSTDPMFFELTCRIAEEPKSASKPKPSAGLPAGADVGKSSAAPGPSTQGLIQRTRLRLKPDDLWVGRDTDAFSGLSAASFAIVNDVQAAKNTLDLHFTVGYAFDALQIGRSISYSIPYFKYDRNYVDGGKAPPNSSSTENIAVGLLHHSTFPVLEDLYSTVTFQPQYVQSLRSGAEILSFRLAYSPNPLVPYLGFIAETPVPGLWATAYARGVVNYYEVLKPSNDNLLNAKGNFVHAGFQAGGVLIVKSAQSPFAGLSFPLDYTNLRGLSGPYKSVELLQTGINYALPRTKYVTVGLSYTRGRNLDTFEKQQVYKASLGLKY